MATIRLELTASCPMASTGEHSMHKIDFCFIVEPRGLRHACFKMFTVKLKPCGFLIPQEYKMVFEYSLQILWSLIVLANSV